MREPAGKAAAERLKPFADEEEPAEGLGAEG